MPRKHRVKKSNKMTNAGNKKKAQNSGTPHGGGKKRTKKRGKLNVSARKVKQIANSSKKSVMHDNGLEVIGEETKSIVLRLLGDKTLECELQNSEYEADANLLQDLDLIVLGAATGDYKKYTELLRREYAHLDNEHYKQMRLKVLEALLMIPNIYASTEFQRKYESSARQNIKQEIDELKAI